MNGPELLAARREARASAERAYIEQAKASAARHGLSLTCQDKPVDQHGTCIELRAASTSLMANRLRAELETGLSATWRGRLALRLSRWYARRRATR